MYSDIFLKGFKKWSWIMLVIFSFLQCIFFWSIENIFSVGVVCLGWFLASIFVMTTKNLTEFSLSTLVILGYSLTQFLMPLIFTFLEGKPLIYNLNFPYDVFLHSILGLILMISCHRVYISNKFISNYSRKRIQERLKKLHLYTAPTDSQIWIMGTVGLFSMFVSYFYLKKSYENTSEGVLNKFIEGLIPFSYAPYFLLIKKLYSNSEKKNNVNTFSIVIFSILLFAVGIGGNARALFITGIVAAGIGYFLGLLIGKFDYRIIKIKNIFFFSLVISILVGPLTNLGIAMVIVRSQRGSISKFEMLEKTLKVYSEEKQIDNFKKSTKLIFRDWDEEYFDNIFLARFCNLKFNDIGFKQYYKLNGQNEKMLDYSIDRFWAVLPTPILSLLQINIDKEKIMSASIGDQLLHVAGGENALGGFRTGQFASTGMVAFGWWYLLILGLGLFPLYFMFDLFVVYRSFDKTYQNYISLCGLLPLTSIFMFLSLSTTSQSVIFIYTYVIRDWIQIVILYYFLYTISKKIKYIFKI